jgi:hypothetical protein
MKIRAKLCDVDGYQALIRLQFHNRRTSDDKIEAVLPDDLRTVPDLDLPLALDGKAAGTQFRKQGARVDALQETRPERFIDSRRGIHDFVDERCGFHTPKAWLSQQIRNGD